MELCNLTIIHEEDSSEALSLDDDVQLLQLNNSIVTFGRSNKSFKLLCDTDITTGQIFIMLLPAYKLSNILLDKVQIQIWKEDREVIFDQTVEAGETTGLTAEYVPPSRWGSSPFLLCSFAPGPRCPAL